MSYKRRWSKASLARFSKQGKTIPCFGCKVPLPYAGVGRHPKWCYECYRSFRSREHKLDRQLYRAVGLTWKEKRA